MSVGTIDEIGNIHDRAGRFAGHVHGEAAAAVLDSHTVGHGTYSDIKDRDARTRQMRDDLEAAVTDLVESGQLQDWLDSIALSRQRHWSFGNQLLAALQYRGLRAGQDDELRAAYPEPMMMSKTAWARLGRNINAGTRAIWINRPLVGKGTRTNPLTGLDEEYFFTRGFIPQAEYDISQTNGEQVPGYAAIHPKMIAGEFDSKAIDGLAARIADSGYTVIEREISDFDPAAGTGTFGQTDPATKQVVIDPRTPPATRVNVYAHELAHIQLGHVDDMDAYRAHRGRLETEAEAAAYIVVRSLGGDPGSGDSFSAPYITSWARNEDRAGITKALDRATAAANKILDGHW